MKKTFIITGVNRGLGKGFVDVLIQDKDCFIIAISRSLTKEQKEYSSKRFYFLDEYKVIVLEATANLMQIF